jgi:predicted DNA-binding transcriptional regulator AlpA
MLNVIRSLLEKLIKDIDSGNSNITEEEQQKIVGMLSEITDNRMSKYQACQYLNVSRATFDNLVRDGYLPEGKHQAGFKEKYWRRSDILKYTPMSK